MPSNTSRLTRRDLLGAGALAGAALSLRSIASQETHPNPAVAGRPVPPPSQPWDPNRVPLSRSGSYLTVSRRFWSFNPSEGVEAGEFYLRCLQDDPTPPEMFRLEMLVDGKPVTPVAESTAARYALRSGNALLEFCIADLDTIRIRGSGCSLRLHAVMRGYGNAFPVRDGVWRIMPDPVRSAIEITRLRGGMEVDAPWVDRTFSVQCDRASILLHEQGEPSFESSLHFFQAAPRGDRHGVSFDDAVRAVEAEFDAWSNHQAPLSSPYDSSRRLALYVLWSSTVAPRGLYVRPVVWCSKNWMARIWSWDHCFVALGLAQSHPALAWEQFALFRDMQDPVTGMLADSFSNVQRSWWCTKNPVHGWTLSRLLRLMPASITKEHLRQVYVPLQQWTEFWMRERDLDGDGLPCIVHPDESFDNTTSNDLGGPSKPPEIATYLALQMQTLADVARRLGDPAAARRWTGERDRLITAMTRILWEPDRRRFVSRRVGDGHTATGDCLLAYMPLMLGTLLPPEIRQVLLQGLKRPGGFLTPYGFSTEALDSPRYDGNSYVKGPVWAPLNLFLIDALDEAGESALARQVQSGFCDIAARSGMSEHFDAKNGSPQGDFVYNWTAALFLLLGTENARKQGPFPHPRI